MTTTTAMMAFHSIRMSVTKTEAYVVSVDQRNLVSTKGISMFLHEYRKGKTDPTTNPWLHKGNVIRQTAPSRLHPSAIAHSSNSLGTCNMKPRMIHNASGNDMKTNMVTRAGIRSTSFIWLKNV